MEDKFEAYEKGSRDTTVNWDNTLKGIKDSYDQHRGLVHGIQKDAIQNGWDARINREQGTGWKFTFELVRDGDDALFVMRDEGTTGLTGRILEEEEYTEELPPGERWARFESLAFIKEEAGGSLGSRGQGKFIFVAGSGNKTIVYDTYREDGTYRAGMRRVKKTRSPVVAWDGEEGREKFDDLTGNLLEPFQSVGTRVVIVDPVDELLESVESGGFLRYVGETWWEIILEYDATIELVVDGETFTATIPEEFNLVEEDTDNLRCWTREFEMVEDEYKIKKLHIISSNDDVPNDLNGISIQRGGMKVDVIEPKYLPRDISKSIYGYITVDDDVEDELKRAENLTHYGFSYRYKAPKAIRNYVEKQCEKFAQEKLGWQSSRQAVRARRQRNAERMALRQINRIAEEFDFPSTPGMGGDSGGSGGTGGNGGGGGSPKPLRIWMPDLKLPREDDLRVDYGESVGDIQAKAINESADPLEVKLKIYIRKNDELKRVYLNEELWLSSGTSSDSYGPFEQHFEEEEFDPGRYTVVARLILLSDEDFGGVLDEKRKSFYLEEEPPSGGGIFEDCEAVEFDTTSRLMGWVTGGDEGGYRLQYNVLHPAYKDVWESEEDLAEYLFRIMALELYRVDLERGEPVIFTDLGGEVSPGEIAYEIVEELSEFTYQYHAGEG